MRLEFLIKVIKESFFSSLNIKIKVISFCFIGAILILIKVTQTNFKFSYSFLKIA